LASEGAGDNCQLGGTRVQVGLDDGLPTGTPRNGVLEGGEVDQTSYLCQPEPVGLPAYATAFDSPERCYFFDNNLASNVWHYFTNRIIAGAGLTNGFWSFPADVGTHPVSPNNDTGTGYGTLVQMPMRSVLVRAPGLAPYNVANLRKAFFSNFDASMSSVVTPVFSDGYAGNCNLVSSSETEFLCYDGSGIRHYDVATNGAAFTWTKTVPLAVQPSNNCSATCYAGSFAWDGDYYYLADDGTASANLDYLVYSPTGALVDTVTANGAGGLNGLYFDWGVYRYASHDGYGQRTGTSNFDVGSDTQCYSAVRADFVPPILD